MIAGERLYPLLGMLVDGRVYPMIVPESVSQSCPYIVWQIISSQPETTYDGDTGHEWIRIQIDIYHDNYDECVQLSHDVVGILDRNIQPSLYDGTQQLYDHETKLFRQSIDFEFGQTNKPNQLKIETLQLFGVNGKPFLASIEKLANEDLPENE